MSKVQAVIFDWAGTTVDYGCFAPVAAFVEVFKEWGIDVELDEVRKPMGSLKRDHIEIMLQMTRINELFRAKHGREYTTEDLDVMEEAFIKKLMSQLSDHTSLKPHLLEALELLRSKGIKIGSTTGYTRDMLNPVAKAATEAGYTPDHSVTPDEVGGLGRPHPNMVDKNLEYLGVTDRDAVIKIGDTVSDIEEGLAAGVMSVGVIEGSSIMGLSEAEYLGLSEGEKDAHIKRTREVYEAAGADRVIMNLSEIGELIG